MADNDPGQEPEKVEGQEPTTPEQQDTFSREYVEKLRQEAADNRVKLKDYQDAQTAAESLRLEKLGEWQQLAEARAAEITELSVFKGQFEAVQKAMDKRNKERIEQIPEDMQSFVPEYSDPSQLATWLDTNWTRLNAMPLVPTLNGNTGGNQQRGPKITLSAAEIKMAENMGLTTEQYMQGKASTGR